MVPLKRTSIRLAVTAFVALAGCRLPPYDPEVSLALLTASRMDRVGSVGPFHGDISSEPQYTFVPDRDVLYPGMPLAGWVVWVTQASVAARYCAGGSSVSYGQWGSSLADGADLRLLKAAVSSIPGPSAASDRLLLMGFRAANEAWLLQLRENAAAVASEAAPLVPPPDHDFRLFVDNGPAYPNMAPGIIGAGAVAGPALDQVELRFLSRDIAPGLYREGRIVWFGAGPVVAMEAEEPSAVLGLPDPIATSSYYHFSPLTGYAYLSVAGPDRAYTTYRWDHSSFVAEPLGLAERVEAVLSTGHLFSRDRYEAQIRDPDGRRVTRFPMGALDFVGEYWDSIEGRFRMLFVLPLLAGEGDGESRKLSFEVYSWPTAEVTRLR